MESNISSSPQGKAVIRRLSSHYRSGNDSLGSQFFNPCLKFCSEYRRAVGYFSSKALIKWLEVLPRFNSENVRIYLLISPELSDGDHKALAKSIDEYERQRLRQLSADQLIQDLIAELSTSNLSIQNRILLFSWMIANEYLELRFAFPEHVEQPGIFHEKIGIFNFSWNDRVAFTGSANESENGYERNYESIDVYRSWVTADKERVQIKEEQFEEAWQAKAAGLKVLPLSDDSAKLIKSKAPSTKPTELFRKNFDLSTANEQSSPYKHSLSSTSLKKTTGKWRHQDEAVDKFLEIQHGVLEMATGTGKTRTAIKALTKLIERDHIDGIVISADGTDLLDQWRKEIEPWAVRLAEPFRVLRHYAQHHELGEFALSPKHAVLVISREQLSSLFNRLEAPQKERLIIIHDEVHGLGSPSLCTKLLGQHQSFGYRLGLSATPEREYDREGTNFILNEIGSIFFKFGLKEAIERGILCEFDYVPLSYPITESDRYRLQQVYAKKAARQREGRPMTNQELWTELARVYKTAEKKPEVFANYLKKNPRIIESAILFVEDKAYGKEILETLHSYTHRYRTYYAEDDRQNLVQFSKGKIDCLITCHRISQGIDIRNLKNVILFSSSRARLETIQRIGRCLRSDPSFPNKRATVVDFIRDSQDTESGLNSDADRCTWLSELSQIRRLE